MPRILNYQDVLAINTRSLEYFNTHITALHSRKVLEAALEQGGFFDRPGFFSNLPRQAVVDAASGLVEIAPIERSRLINIKVEHSVPEIASDLANAIAKAYIQQDLDSRMQTTIEAVEWLRERSEEYRERLERVARIAGLSRTSSSAETTRISSSKNSSAQQRADHGADRTHSGGNPVARGQSQMDKGRAGQNRHRAAR